MNVDSSNTKRVPLFAGSRFEHLRAVQGERLAFVDAPEVGACFLVAGDIAIGIQRSSFDNISRDLIEATPEGDKPFRLVFTECRVVVGLTDEEVDFLMGVKEGARGGTLALAPEAPQAPETSPEEIPEGIPQAPVQAAEQDNEPVTAQASEPAPGKAKGGAKSAAKPAKAPAKKAAVKAPAKGPDKAAAAKKTAAKAQPATKAPASKAAATKAPAKSAAKPPATKAAATKAPAKAAASATDGEVASVQDVIDAARRLIQQAGQPIPRRQLFDALTGELGRLPGKDPIENMATILYKDKNHEFTNIRGRGFWLTKEPVPPVAA